VTIFEQDHTPEARGKLRASLPQDAVSVIGNRIKELPTA
jgi:hypothetical protein